MEVLAGRVETSDAAASPTCALCDRLQNGVQRKGGSGGRHVVGEAVVDGLKDDPVKSIRHSDDCISEGTDKLLHGGGLPAWFFLHQQAYRESHRHSSHATARTQLMPTSFSPTTTYVGVVGLWFRLRRIGTSDRWAGGGSPGPPQLSKVLMPGIRSHGRGVDAVAPGCYTPSESTAAVTSPEEMGKWSSGPDFPTTQGPRGPSDRRDSQHG